MQRWVQPVAAATTCLTCVPVTGASPSAQWGSRGQSLSAPPVWPHPGREARCTPAPPRRTGVQRGAASCPEPLLANLEGGFTPSRGHTWGSRQDPAGPCAELGGVQSWVRGRTCVCMGVPRSAAPLQPSSSRGLRTRTAVLAQLWEEAIRPWKLVQEMGTRQKQKARLARRKPGNAVNGHSLTSAGAPSRAEVTPGNGRMPESRVLIPEEAAREGEAGRCHRSGGQAAPERKCAGSGAAVTHSSVTVTECFGC